MMVLETEKKNRHHRRTSSVAPPVPTRRNSLLAKQKARLVNPKTSIDQAAVASLPRTADSTKPLLSPPPSEPHKQKPKKPKVPTRNDTPADFFIVVGLETGQRTKTTKEQEQQASMNTTMTDQSSQDFQEDPPSSRVRPSDSQGSLSNNHHDTMSVDLLLPEQRELTPKILDRYPRDDYKNATVDPMISAFCMPLGVIALPTTDPRNNGNNGNNGNNRSGMVGMPPETHQFTLTTGDGSKVYCVSLKFYEEVSVGSLCLPNPTLGQLLSEEGPYLNMFVDWLTTSGGKDGSAQDGDSSRDAGEEEEEEEEEEELAKKIAIESMTAWRILHQYSIDVVSATTEVGYESITKRTKRLAQELMDACAGLEEESCVSWLLDTELYEDLMHFFEERQEVVVGEEKVEGVEKQQVDDEWRRSTKTSTNLKTRRSDKDATTNATASSDTSATTATTTTATTTTATTTATTDTTNTSMVVDTLSLSSACDALEKQMFSAYKKYLRVVSETRRLVPKCLVLTGRHPFYQVYTSVLQSLHTLLCLDPNWCGTNSVPLPMPIERFIVFFLDEIPLPPCGKERFHFSLAPSSEFSLLLPIIEMERPPLNRLPLANFSYDILIQCLSVTQIISVVTSLLLDQKVIVLSEDITKISLVGECLCSLLFPFRWQNPYIPLLPRSMQDMVYAPMGYLMGMHMSLYPGDDDPMLAGEVVVVDLDESVLVMPDTTTMPMALPKKARAQLTRDVQAAVQKADESSRSKSLREAFIMCFARLLRGYKMFLSSSESFEELFDKKVRRVFCFFVFFVCSYWSLTKN